MEFNEKELHIIPLSLVKVSNSIEVFLVEGRPDLRTPPQLANKQTLTTSKRLSLPFAIFLHIG